MPSSSVRRRSATSRTSRCGSCAGWRANVVLGTRAGRASSSTGTGSGPSSSATTATTRRSGSTSCCRGSEGRQDRALASDAGLPGVNDPGARLISAAIERGIEVTVLPGPSAVETALVASGLVGERYSFVGYLPRGREALTTACGRRPPPGRPGRGVRVAWPRRLQARCARSRRPTPSARSPSAAS
jgi:hypothetical protein